MSKLLNLFCKEIHANCAALRESDPRKLIQILRRQSEILKEIDIILERRSKDVSRNDGKPPTVSPLGSIAIECEVEPRASS
jgi:hypothetical protein